MKAGWPLALVPALLVLGLVLPEYHQGNLARILVLATFAAGYNIAFGYTGLLSLGHALYFAAGLYGMGMAMQFGGAGPLSAMVAGVLAAALAAAILGALALRTRGVGFMIVTLMFAQAGYLTIFYFGEWTRGDEGFVLDRAARSLAGFDPADPVHRVMAALVVFALGLAATVAAVRAPFGKALVAIRENEERAAMLGYDTQRLKLYAMILSGALSGLAGAGYGLLFGYVGATFAGVQYSILPLLWVLLGGAGTVIGPLIGTAFMFYAIDILSGWTSAYLIFVGLALVGLTLFAPEGIAGTIRRRMRRA